MLRDRQLQLFKCENPTCCRYNIPKQLTGNIVRFKKLDVIYTGDDYVVSKMIKEDTYDENKVPYLKIYDAVILEGKDLKDGKLISY